MQALKQQGDQASTAQCTAEIEPANAELSLPGETKPTPNGNDDYKHE
jgi:hypothetical protein